MLPNSSKHDEERGDTEESDEPAKRMSFVTVNCIDSINFDNISMRCFKEVELSSSSLFRNPLYFFPELDDPGIYEAFKFEPPLPIDNDVGNESYIRHCHTLDIPPFKRVLQSLDQEVLDLKYYALRPKELRAIFQVLEMNAYVNTLILQDSWMEEDSVVLLSNMLTQNETITTLNLKQCQIGPRGTRALNTALEQNTTLEELDLSHNSIGNEGLRHLRPTLKNNKTLIKIDLGHNNLTSGSGNVLQQFFANNDVIEDVNLEWNNLGDDDTIKKIGAGLKDNQTLISLNLAWNGLESLTAAKQLARFFRDSKKLEFVDLSNNRFKSTPAMCIKKGVGESETLTHAKFGSNPLNVTEAAAFGTMFIQSNSLKTLDLENIYFHKSFLANLKKIKKAGKNLIYAGVLQNYKIQGPSVRSVLLKRCNYLGLKPKKSKAKRDFGIILLKLPEEPMLKADFEHFIRRKMKAKMYDKDLLAEVEKAFAYSKTQVDCQNLVAEYMKMYPDTVLPPSKDKKKKKKKGRRKKTPATSSTATSTATEPSTLEKTPGTSSVSSIRGSAKATSSQSVKYNESSERTVPSEGSELPAEVAIPAEVSIDVKPSSSVTSGGKNGTLVRSSEKMKSSVRITEPIKADDE